MIIREDDHYIRDKADREEFVSRGLAFQGVYHLRFSYQTTPERTDAYLKKLHEYDNDAIARDRFLEETFRERSGLMLSVMEKIAEKFPTHQFYKDGRNATPYASDSWDFFFWCNSRKCSDGYHRDYTYFTLSPNKDHHTPEQQSADIERLLSFLRETCADLDWLDVAVQLDVRYDEPKIAAAVSEAVPRLNGVKCSWHDMDGKVVVTERGVFFVKKYARTRGYKLDDNDVLRLAWKFCKAG